MLIVVLVATGCGDGRKARAPTTAPLSGTPTVQFGYVKSITRLGTAYKLRFDLGVRLSGETAVRACIENDGCPPRTTGFPDDVYQHDLGYVLTYRVPPNARVLMVAAGRPTPIRVTPAELYSFMRGRDPRHLRLMDPTLKHLGFYVETKPRYPGFDEATRLEQAYHP
jgi:hypothetical protein